MKNRSFLLFCLLGMTLFSPACDPFGAEPSNLTLMETLRGISQLSTFVAALEKTGLTARVENTTADLTLFAPTNAAFTTYLTANAYAQLDDVPVAGLKQLLLYHLAAGRVKTTDFVSGSFNSLANSATTATPMQLYIDSSNGWRVNTIPVSGADNEAENGLVQIIDQVLDLPTVITPLRSNPIYFSIFSQALSRADLGTDYVSTLSAAGSFTILAPLDQAFTDFFAEKGYANLNAVPADLLNAIIQYHIVPGPGLTGANLSGLQELSTLGGKKITLTAGTQLTDLSGRTANLFVFDLQTTNGIVHSVDKVLLPN